MPIPDPYAPDRAALARLRTLLDDADKALAYIDTGGTGGDDAHNLTLAELTAAAAAATLQSVSAVNSPAEPPIVLAAKRAAAAAESLLSEARFA